MVYSIYRVDLSRYPGSGRHMSQCHLKLASIHRLQLQLFATVLDTVLQCGVEPECNQIAKHVKPVKPVLAVFGYTSNQGPCLVPTP